MLQASGIDKIVEDKIRQTKDGYPLIPEVKKLVLGWHFVEMYVTPMQVFPKFCGLKTMFPCLLKQLKTCCAIRIKDLFRGFGMHFYHTGVRCGGCSWSFFLKKGIGHLSKSLFVCLFNFLRFYEL